MISYDLKAHILEDFTQDKRAIMGAVSSLQPGMAMSQETNLFDSLYDTLDRLENMEGRKYIILISSGRDSFSKHTLDQTLKKVQASKDIAIYTVSTGKALLNYAETHGLMVPVPHHRIQLQHDVPSGRQPDEDVCQNDRRKVL